MLRMNDTGCTFFEKSHVHCDFLEPDHRGHTSVGSKVAARNVEETEDVGATEDASRGVTPGPGDCRGRVAINLTRQSRSVAEVGRHVRGLRHELRPVWNLTNIGNIVKTLFSYISEKLTLFHN